jgi:hypothetical protein
MTMQSSSHFSSNPSLQISPMSASSQLASPKLSVTALPSFDADALDPTQSLNRLQQIIDLLDSSLRLPNNPRAFMTYLLGLIIVFAGAFVHVLMAAQIMQAEFTLAQLQEEYRAIEQQNGDIIFQIARDSNMNRLQERVLAQGYVQVEEREYVFVAPEMLADAAGTGNNTANNSMAQAANNEETPVASASTQATSAALPSGTGANIGGGQFAQWEEFWRMTWLSAPSANAGMTQTSTSQVSNAAPAVWSTWWEQTTERGSKLFDQFRSQ